MRGMRDSYGSLPVTAAFLAGWREEVSAAVVAGFEEKYGYGPEENAIHPPEAADRTAADRIAAEASGFADLAAYYGEIGAVHMGDIGNGYFLHPASHAVDERTALPEAGGAVPAVLIGSDGGGILYAVAPDGAVWRSRTSSEEGGFDRITDGLAEFLDLLRRSVHRFDDSGQPGLV